jgi:hypothetical protein
MPRTSPAQARERALARALQAELDALALLYARQEVRDLTRLRKSAADRDARAEERLWGRVAALLARFGARAVSDAATEVTAGSLVQGVLEGRTPRIKVFQEWRAGLDRRVSDLRESTREAVRAAVQTIVSEAEAEVPRPSTGSIARRIRTQLTAEEGRVLAFSSERAALIARTELNIGANTGLAGGYEALGVEQIEWIAYRDGRSGDRHHERMHGKRTRLGEPFTLPSGAQLRWPGDQDGPIGELANCRCTTRAVKPRRAT